MLLEDCLVKLALPPVFVGCALGFSGLSCQKLEYDAVGPYVLVLAEMEDWRAECYLRRKGMPVS